MSSSLVDGAINAALIIWTWRYVAIASTVAYIYDHAITLGAEIGYIWPSPWGLSKVLFFATRYLVYVDIFLNTWRQYWEISIDLDSAIWRTTIWLLIPGSFIADCILILRTYAIYGRNKVIGGGLLALLVLQEIPVIVITQKVLSSVKIVPCVGDLPRCIDIVGSGDIEAIFFVFIMLTELLILILTVRRGIVQSRLYTVNSRILQTLYRDGVIFFVYITVLSLVNLLNLIFNRPSSTLFLIPMRTLHSTFSARILLHLREAAKDDTTSTTQHALTDPTFFVSDHNRSDGIGESSRLENVVE